MFITDLNRNCQFNPETVQRLRPNNFSVRAKQPYSNNCLVYDIHTVALHASFICWVVMCVRAVVHSTKTHPTANVVQYYFYSVENELKWRKRMQYGFGMWLLPFHAWSTVSHKYTNIDTQRRHRSNNTMGRTIKAQHTHACGRWRANVKLAPTGCDTIFRGKAYEREGTAMLATNRYDRSSTTPFQYGKYESGKIQRKHFPHRFGFAEYGAYTWKLYHGMCLCCCFFLVIFVILSNDLQWMRWALNSLHVVVACALRMFPMNATSIDTTWSTIYNLNALTGVFFDTIFNAATGQ